jgi:redox-sensitive bicupin YhaK (pirin superfamily)
MDDRVDLPPGRHAGGAHPHAGFEIATFVVDGVLRDRDEGALSAGDVAWMTAGSGVIHNEDMKALGKVRVLQLWVTLPSAFRWAAPRFSRQAFEEVPVRREPGIEAHVYSGSSGWVEAGAHTYLPLTMVDIRLKPHAVFHHDLPAAYNGFVYVL